jgi:hypothetical protein
VETQNAQVPEVPISVVPLVRQRQKVQRINEKLYQDARQKNLPAEETNRIYHQSVEELQDVDTNIAKLQSDYFLTQAIKYSVDLPPQNPHGAWTMSSGTRHLTPSGVAQLRSSLRAAKKDRSEYLRTWLGSIGTIITGIGGVIGMVIALLTLLWHHGSTPH